MLFGVEVPFALRVKGVRGVFYKVAGVLLLIGVGRIGSQSGDMRNLVNSHNRRAQIAPCDFSHHLHVVPGPALSYVAPPIM